MNLNDGLLEHLLTKVGVLGKVNPFSPLSLDCLFPFIVDALLSNKSPLGDEATIDVIPLFGVPFPGKEEVSGIDGGGIIDVDWWCLNLDKILRELLGLSLGACKFAVDTELVVGRSGCPELSTAACVLGLNRLAHEASLRF